MRRAVLAVVVLAIAVLLPATELEFPPDVAVVRADPALSGALPTEPANSDFVGASIGDVGTPPTNHDIETAETAVGTPPANSGFSSGDFTSWALTGSPTVQSGGPNGYYAQLATGQAVKSDAFTVSSTAQQLTFQIAAVNTGTFQWKLVLYTGPSYTAQPPKYFTTCPTTCTNWNSYVLDAVPYQGQSIKVGIERYLGDLKLDQVAVGQEALSNWTVANGEKVSRQTGGPTGAYAKTTGSITTQAFTVNSNAQNGSVDLKVDSASGSYQIFALSGAGYSTATQVFSGVQGDSSSWGTKTFGVGDYVGQSVKLEVRPATGTTVLVDKAGLSKHVVPGWTATTTDPIARGSESGIDYLLGVGELTSTSFTPVSSSLLGSVPVQWFRIVYRMKANYNTGGTDLGSTLLVRHNSIVRFSAAGKDVGPPVYDPVNVWLEKFFYVPVSAGSGGFKINGWGPTVFGCSPRCDGRPDVMVIQAVDGPGAAGPLTLPLPGDIMAYPVDVEAEPTGDVTDDPVDVVSGNFYQGHTDLAVPGKGVALTFTRAYSAKANTNELGTPSVLGAKWSHNWQASIKEADANNAVVKFPNGAAETWSKVSGSYVPPPGIKGTLVKNGGGDWTLTTAHQYVYAFDSAGKWTSVKDRNNNTTTLGYTGSQLTTITDPGGRALTLTYTTGRISSASDGLGRTVSYGYDANGDLTTITDVLGHTVSYQYSAHLLTLGTDAKGNVFVRNTYDTRGRVTQQLDAANGTTTIAYDTPGAGATRVTNQRSKQTTYYFDTKMRITDVMDHNGGVTTKTFDTKNNPLTATNPLGKVWTYTYDASGNVLTAKDPLLKTWTYTYNSRNDVVTATDPLSKVTTYRYDTAGNLTSVTDANNKVTTFTVNGSGLVTAVTDPLNHATTFGYDSYGNRTTVTNALSKTWTYAFDTKGRVTSVTDPLTHATTFTYNNANLVLTATNALNKTTTYTYDNNGNVLTATDAKANVTTYAYDNKDQLTSITDDLSQVWTFAYDAVGNLTSKTNPRSKTTNYVYDNLSRLTSETDPRIQVRSYAYDAAGRLTSRTDPKSQTIAYTYNDRNELTLIDYTTGTDTSFAYNDSGARTQMVDGTGTTTYSYDSLYRLTSVTFPGSRTVSYGYDDAGRRTSMTYPGGTNQVTYGYDNANRLTSVTDWGSNVISYSYDDAGRMTTKTLPSGTGVVSSYTYDNADRLTGISHVKGGSTTLASVAYTLDDVGNRMQRVDQQGTHTYAYDDVYRLTSVTYPGPATTSYTFDAFGNRLTKTDSSGTTNSTYDDADRLTSVDPPGAPPAVTYTWDNNGNLTNRGSDTFAWDYEDRMTSATVGGTTTSFVYRGDGLRNTRTTGGATTTFTWDVAAGLPVVIDDGKQYVYGAGLEQMVASGSRYYYLADGLGSTMAIVDSTGTVQKSYTYDIYGKPAASGALANEFDFIGQQTDGTGLQYLRARYMDPETGMFLSREPLARRPGWTGNPFGYVLANPIRFLDMSGLRPVDSDEENLEVDWQDLAQRCTHEAQFGNLSSDTCDALIDLGNDEGGNVTGQFNVPDPIVDAFNLGRDIEAWFLVVGTRQIVGEYFHGKIRDCALSDSCRAGLDELFDFKTIASADIALLLAMQPEIAAILTASPEIWWAYKRVYDSSELRGKVGD